MLNRWFTFDNRQPKGTTRKAYCCPSKTVARLTNNSAPYTITLREKEKRKQRRKRTKEHPALTSPPCSPSNTTGITPSSNNIHQTIRHDLPSFEVHLRPQENEQKKWKEKKTYIATINFDITRHLTGHTWQESSITVILFSRSLLSTRENIHSFESLVCF